MHLKSLQLYLVLILAIVSVYERKLNAAIITLKERNQSS